MLGLALVVIFAVTVSRTLVEFVGVLGDRVVHEIIILKIVAIATGYDAMLNVTISRLPAGNLCIGCSIPELYHGTDSLITF